MITISATDKGMCSVSTGSASFDVFPEKPGKGWSLLAHPEEELSEKAISWPGEYDFAGLTLRGIGQEDGKQVSYSCNAEGVRLAFVGDPVMEWKDSDIQFLGDIDVLVIAADKQKHVVELVEAVDPRIVVLVPTDKGDLPGITKTIGAKAENMTELKIKAGSLPSDNRQVVVLGK